MFSRLKAFFATLLADLESPPIGPRFRPAHVWLSITLALALSMAARITGADLAFQQAVYEAGDQSWRLGEHPFWRSLYEFGPIPALVAVVLAMVGFFLSWSRSGFRRWRRVFLYVILVVVTGPGLLANALLKEQWGRPRPREVEGLGGHHVFEPVLAIDPGSTGKSFPCGHATMGFVIFMGYFLLRRHRPRLALGFLITALVVGSMMGLARSLQGAHFLTDTVWAAFVCWIASLVLYHALGLDLALARSMPGSKKYPLWAKVGGAAAGLAVLAGIAFGTPFREVRNFYLVEEFAKQKPLQIVLSFAAGEIDIVPGEEFRIEGESYGHGLPTSKIAGQYYEQDTGDLALVVYQERISGLPTEANQQLRVTIPWDRVRSASLTVHDAEVWLELPRPPGREGEGVMLGAGNGAVVVRSAGRAVEFTGKRGVEFGNHAVSSPDDGTPFQISVSDDFAGHLTVEAVESP